MLQKISTALQIQNVSFDAEEQRVRCLAHVINLSAKKLINCICATPYDDEESFETLEDNDERLKEVIYKVINILKILLLI
jgi:hypothetical protein